MAEDVAAVLLTCSTLGPAVKLVRAPIPVLRADAALAVVASRGGGRVVALCALETTLAPTRALFAEAAGRHGASLAVRLVPGAADADFAAGADRVALAQASMAGAAAPCRRGTPLISPGVGLASALPAA